MAVYTMTELGREHTFSDMPTVLTVIITPSSSIGCPLALHTLCCLHKPLQGLANILGHPCCI
jgi:hypothetical protein